MIPNLYIGNGWKSPNIHFLMVVWGSRKVIEKYHSTEHLIEPKTQPKRLFSLKANKPKHCSHHDHHHSQEPTSMTHATNMTTLHIKKDGDTSSSFIGHDTKQCASLRRHGLFGFGDAPRRLGAFVIQKSVTTFIQWLFLVPLKGGIGSIFHPPEGKDYKWYISGIFPAHWGMHYATHLPPFTGNQKQPLNWFMLGEVHEVKAEGSTLSPKIHGFSGKLGYTKWKETIILEIGSHFPLNHGAMGGSG